jgi:hypothetical protein
VRSSNWRLSQVSGFRYQGGIGDQVSVGESSQSPAQPHSFSAQACRVGLRDLPNRLLERMGGGSRRTFGMRFVAEMPFEPAMEAQKVPKRI